MLFLSANSWLKSWMAKRTSASLVQVLLHRILFFQIHGKKPSPPPPPPRPPSDFVSLHVFFSCVSLNLLSPWGRTALGSHKHFFHKALWYYHRHTTLQTKNCFAKRWRCSTCGVQKSKSYLVYTPLPWKHLFSWLNLLSMILSLHKLKTWWLIWI